MHRDFKQLNDRVFDLLICGGGIYGAWTAYDASLRGLQVAIVDKSDWGSGTSSASSKLIHGGLRYLETLDFKLVKKSLIERQMLLKTAPHRVWPLRFGIPVYADSRFNRIQLKIGLSIYDFLAGSLSDTDSHRFFDAKAFTQHFPDLETTHLKGGFTYSDAQTDDARFVLELIDGAISAGAVCLNYCEVVQLSEVRGIVTGANVIDKTDNSQASVRAKCVVDTTGRWSANLRHTEQNFRLSKGIHLIMPKILHHDALLLTAQSDNRVFFIIPWYGLTLVGTTDANYIGDLDAHTITQEEITYLLSEANRALTKVCWTENDIIGKFTGLRVLQDSKLDNPTKISRDWALEKATNGLFSSIGGKFTSAREDTAIIVDTVCNKLGNQTKCKTFGKAFPWLSDVDYTTLFEQSLARGMKLGIAKETTGWLVRRHGTRVTQLFELCEKSPSLSEKIRPDLPFLLAEAVFCAQNEMVVHLDDLLRRRIPVLILAKLSREEITRLAHLVADALSWDQDTMNDELKSCLQLTR
jgi:glycerol-3-phosphate dehydrogenase